MDDKLILNNLHLVNYVIKRLNIFDINNYDDYYQIGIMGLIKASATYNEEKNVAFCTYGYACIKNEILKNINTKKNNEISINKDICDDLCLSDIIEDTNINIADDLELNDMSKDLCNIIDTRLSYIERTVIRMLFGIGCREYNQIEISNILNIPQYKISRIKKEALDELKKCIDKRYFML